MNLYRFYYFNIKEQRNTAINSDESLCDTVYTERYLRMWEKYMQECTPHGHVFKATKVTLDSDDLDEIKKRWKGINIIDTVTASND